MGRDGSIESLGLYPELGFGMSFIKKNIYDDPILDQPEFVEVLRRLGFRE